MGIQERKQREKNRRINEIITAARKTFIAKGYSSTTMEDIAKESELSRRTLYLYFKSKEEISFELMYSAFTALYDRLREAADHDGSAMERIIRLRDAYIRFYREDFENFYFTVYFEVKLNLGNIAEDDTRRCISVMRDMIGIFAGILQDGGADGSFRVLKNPKRTAFVLAEYLKSFMQNLANHRQLLGPLTGFSEKEILDELFELAFYSLRLEQ